MYLTLCTSYVRLSRLRVSRPPPHASRAFPRRRHRQPVQTGPPLEKLGVHAPFFKVSLGVHGPVRVERVFVRVHRDVRPGVRDFLALLLLARPQRQQIRAPLLRRARQSLRGRARRVRASVVRQEPGASSVAMTSSTATAVARLKSPTEAWPFRSCNAPSTARVQYWRYETRPRSLSGRSGSPGAALAFAELVRKPR